MFANQNPVSFNIATLHLLGLLHSPKYSEKKLQRLLQESEFYYQILKNPKQSKYHSAARKFKIDFENSTISIIMVALKHRHEESIVSISQQARKEGYTQLAKCFDSALKISNYKSDHNQTTTTTTLATTITTSTDISSISKKSMEVISCASEINLSEVDLNITINTCNEAIRTDKNDCLAYYSRGMAYLKLKKYKEASVDFNNCIDRIKILDSTLITALIDAYIQLGMACYQLKDMERVFYVIKAIHYIIMGHYQNIGIDSIKKLLNQADSCLLACKPTETIEIYSELTQLYREFDTGKDELIISGSIYAHLKLGFAYAHEAKYDSAEKNFKLVIELDNSIDELICITLLALQNEQNKKIPEYDAFKMDQYYAELENLTNKRIQFLQLILCISASNQMRYTACVEKAKINSNKADWATKSRIEHLKKAVDYYNEALKFVVTASIYIDRFDAYLNYYYAYIYGDRILPVFQASYQLASVLQNTSEEFFDIPQQSRREEYLPELEFYLKDLDKIDELDSNLSQYRVQQSIQIRKNYHKNKARGYQEIYVCEINRGNTDLAYDYLINALRSYFKEFRKAANGNSYSISIFLQHCAAKKIINEIFHIMNQAIQPIEINCLGQVLNKYYDKNSKLIRDDDLMSGLLNTMYYPLILQKTIDELDSVFLNISFICRASKSKSSIFSTVPDEINKKIMTVLEKPFDELIKEHAFDLLVRQKLISNVVQVKAKANFSQDHLIKFLFAALTKIELFMLKTYTIKNIKKGKIGLESINALLLEKVPTILTNEDRDILASKVVLQKNKLQ